MKPVIVIGHKNPDTDSICSAICYANLKNKLTGETHIPCRAGEVNSETRYVLDRFGVPEPELVESLEPRIIDVQYRQVEGINPHMSLKRAWPYMRDNDIKTAPVLDKFGQLTGILTLGDIARFYMEDQNATALAEAGTRYRNIVDRSGRNGGGRPRKAIYKGERIRRGGKSRVLEEYIHENDMVIHATATSPSSAPSR